MAEVGLSDFYYAILETDSTEALIYRAPVKIPGLIAIDINPNIVDATLYADNGPMESETSISKIDVEIELADIPLKDQAALQGHTYENGGIIKKLSDSAPYVAIGFKALKTDGGYRYQWLKKGKFGASPASHRTKGEQIQYNTPKIKSSFVGTVHDTAYEAKVDDKDPAYSEATGSAWFTDTTLDEGLGATAAYTEP